MHALGIDIGGTSIKFAILRGTLVERELQSEPYQNPSLADLHYRLSQIKSEVREATIGVCVPGAFAPHTTRVTASANIPALVDVDLDRFIQQATGIHAARFVIDTDVFAAATDIWHHQHRPPMEPHRPFRLCVIALGTGVGMSILDNGHRLQINGTSSGHLGQIDVTLDDCPVPTGPDHGRGGLEGYIGLPALHRAYGSALPAAISAMSQHAPPLRALAKAIRVVHAIYRPDEIVIAGGVGLMLRPRAETIRSLVTSGLTALARPHCTINFAPDSFCAARGIARLSALA